MFYQFLTVPCHWFAGKAVNWLMETTISFPQSLRLVNPIYYTCHDVTNTFFDCRARWCMTRSIFLPTMGKLLYNEPFPNGVCALMIMILRIFYASLDRHDPIWLQISTPELCKMCKIMAWYMLYFLCNSNDIFITLELRAHKPFIKCVPWWLV